MSKKFFKSWLIMVSWHRHGGEVDAEFARLEVKPRPIIDFSVNTSPLGVPTEISSWLFEIETKLGSYPSKDGEEVKSYYQQRYGIARDRVIPLNGSIEGIYLWPRALNRKHGLVPVPSFFDYQASLVQNQARVTTLKLCAEDHFNFEALERAITDQDCVILGSPNNPTGQSILGSDLISMVKQHRSVEFLVDQAFVELSDQSEKYSLLSEDEPNLWVLHSLTKEYAIPGLRLGALIAPGGMAQKIESWLHPWRLNTVGLKVALHLASLQEYRFQVTQVLEQERKRLYLKLKDLPCWKLYPSTANFFLARFKEPEKLDAFLADALNSGIFFRDARNFKELEDGYLRFAIKRPEENDQLIQFVQQYL